MSVKFKIICSFSSIEIELWFDDDDEDYKTNNLLMTCFLNVNNVCSAATELEPLSAPQATFEHYGLTWSKWSSCSLIHKFLITGQGEQVVSRRGELNRDLLSRTCEYKNYYGTTISKVRCRVGLKCRLQIKILSTNWNKTEN